MSIEVVPCPFQRGVDLTDDRAGADGDPIHLFPAEWVEFLSAIKDGKYDRRASLGPRDLDTLLGPPTWRDDGGVSIRVASPPKAEPSARTRETRSGLPGSVPYGMTAAITCRLAVNAAGRIAQPTGCQW